MRCRQRLIEYKLGDVFTIYNIADTHRGHVNHNERALCRDVEKIARDPYALWIHCGDVSDAIFPGDKRYKAHEVDPRYRDDPEDQQRQCVLDLKSIFVPIAEKCIGIHSGNHDETGASKTNYHQPRALAHELGVPYLGLNALTRLRFKRGAHVSSLDLHSMHGSGGGATAGAAANYLEKQMATVDADVHFCGHFHRKARVEKNTIGLPRRGRVRVARRLAVGLCTGGYLDSYTDASQDYAEDRGMSAWEGGMVGVRFNPETLELEAI